MASFYWAPRYQAQGVVPLHHYKVIGLIQLSFLAGLDWGDWIYGFSAAVIGGGASSVVSGFSLLVVAPDNFNMAHPGLLVKAMITMFIVNGLLSGFSFLRNKPVPVPVTETTHTMTTVTQPGQPPMVIHSDAKKTVEPVTAVPLDDTKN